MQAKKTTDKCRSCKIPLTHRVNRHRGLCQKCSIERWNARVKKR